MLCMNRGQALLYLHHTALYITYIHMFCYMNFLQENNGIFWLNVPVKKSIKTLLL